jgi:hypothetical protein
MPGWGAGTGARPARRLLSRCWQKLYSIEKKVSNILFWNISF